MIRLYDMPEAYICERCGHVLEGNETQLSYDDTLVCRLCGGNAVNAYHCEICEELVPEDEIDGYEHKVCLRCIEKKRYDLDFCKKVGESDQVAIGTGIGNDNRGLNGYLMSFFTIDEIEDLMLSAMKERAKVRPVDGDGYLKRHCYDAVDMLFSDTND